MSDPDELISLAAAARHASVNPRTVRRWIAAGRLPAYRLGPKLIKVRREDLDGLARPVPLGGGGPPAQPLGGEGRRARL